MITGQLRITITAITPATRLYILRNRMYAGTIAISARMYRNTTNPGSPPKSR